jgi:integrase
VRRHAVYGRTKAEVVDRMLKLRTDASRGILPDPERATVRTYLETWIENTQRPAVSAGTYLLQRSLLRNHVLPRLGRYRLEGLRAEHVDYLLAELEREGKSARLREQVRAVLHRALTVAVKRRRIPFNPVAATERPRVERREVRALTGDEARWLLEAAREDRLWPLFALAITTGMRQGELYALRWGDVDLARRTVYVRRAQTVDHEWKPIEGDTKTDRSRRTIALGTLAIDALRAHRASLAAVPHPTALVFTSPEGGRLLKQNVRRRTWGPLLQRAGLKPIGFHAATRHTMATLALEAGVHPKVVQERLGHSRIATTLDVYSHVPPTLQRQAADLLDAIISDA